MDIDTAKAMLALLLGKHWALFGSFHQFLDVSKSMVDSLLLKVYSVSQYLQIYILSECTHLKDFVSILRREITAADRKLPSYI